MSIFKDVSSKFFLTAIAEDALYIPRTGASTVSCKVVFDEDKFDDSYENTTVSNTDIEIDVLVSQVPQAHNGDIFRIGNTDYMVLDSYPEAEGIRTYKCGKPNYKLFPLVDNNVPFNVKPQDEILKVKVP